MKEVGRHLVRVFVTGALAALPLAATLLIVVWVLGLLLDWVGPHSMIGGLFSSIGFGVGGSVVLGYLIGLGLVVLAIFGLGLAVETRLQPVLAAAVEGLVLRIPLVRNIYDLVARFVDMLSQGNKDGLKSMRPVWCHFGGPGGAVVLGLLSAPDVILIEDRRYLAVVMPTTPVPVGGGLVYVPEEWVTPAEVGMEGFTSIYVSMGVTSPQHLRGPAPGGPAK